MDANVYFNEDYTFMNIQHDIIKESHILDKSFKKKESDLIIKKLKRLKATESYSPVLARGIVYHTFEKNGFNFLYRVLGSVTQENYLHSIITEIKIDDKVRNSNFFKILTAFPDQLELPEGLR